ncbi:MAG: SMI1/KNR4 family protein [Ktedonobacterales bacterium]
MMTTFNWKDLMAQWNQELLADEGIRAELPPEAIASGWLGYPGATEAQIAQLEERLGTSLPPSYRQFLQFSNGWRDTGHFIPAIWSTEEVEWFAVQNQGVIDVWVEGERSDGREQDLVPDD